MITHRPVAGFLTELNRSRLETLAWVEAAGTSLSK
jgi:hypothetical protein